MELDKAIRSNERPWSEFDLYALLGQPDLFRERGGTVEVQYLYNRYGEQDWVTLFEIDPSGALHWRGLNAATPELRKGFEPFPGYLQICGRSAAR